MNSTIQIIPPGASCSDQVGPILRALPEWFGIEESLQEYVVAAGTMPTFLAVDGDQAVGFLTINRHFPESAEIHCVGLLPSHHRRGIGRCMQDACEAWLMADGVRMLQVKTIDPNKKDEAYLKSFAFYRAMGFVPMEVFPDLWQSWNPCLMLVKPLV